jgi:hypothetical protein
MLFSPSGGRGSTFIYNVSTVIAMKITHEKYDPRTGLILFEASDGDGVFCCSVDPEELDQQEWTVLNLNGSKMLTRFNEKRLQIEKAASTAVREARRHGIEHRPSVKNMPLVISLPQVQKR